MALSSVWLPVAVHPTHLPKNQVPSRLLSSRQKMLRLLRLRKLPKQSTLKEMPSILKGRSILRLTQLQPMMAVPVMRLRKKPEKAKCKKDLKSV